MVLRPVCRSASNVRKKIARGAAGFTALLAFSLAVVAGPTIEELKARSFLDDYDSNILYGCGCNTAAVWRSLQPREA
jgi:hypothetical protein